MVQIYSVCGEWKFNENYEWECVIDNNIGGSLSEINENVSFTEFAEMVAEDFGVDMTRNVVKLSYALPLRMKSIVDDSPPMYIRNDRQLRSFISNTNGDSDIIRLYVTVIAKEDQVVDQSMISKTIHSETSYTLDNIQQLIPIVQPLNSTNVNDIIKGLLKPTESEHSVSVAYIEPCSTVLQHPFHSAPDLPAVPIGLCYPSRVTADLHVNKYFKSKDELMTKMRKLAIDWKFEFKSNWSDKSRVVLGCVDDKCTWKMRAIRLKPSSFFVVKTYVPEHSCDTTYRNANHRQATASLLGSILCSNYGEKKDGLKPKQIIEHARREFGVHINYQKAWRVRDIAHNLIRGTPEDSYQNLAKWLFMAKEKNPGSVVFLELDPFGKFKYAFIAFGASIRGFSLMRRVIAVDGTFLKAKYKGTLLGATTQDGDFHLYPLAFAIVDSENDDSWNWFFRCLTTIIPDADDLVFVSDRAKSIANGLSKIYPTSHHGICRVHFLRNVKSSFGKRSFLVLVEAAANAYTIQEFSQIFEDIKISNPKLATYLEDADFKKWARCFSPTNRYNMMTTNIAESLNSMLGDPREYPIISLLETIRLTLTTWFHERREKAAKHGKHVTPNVVKKLVERYDEAMTLDVHQVDQYEFEIKDERKKYIVHLQNKQCTCCVFDIDKIPCVHAIAAAKRNHMDENRLVDGFYLTDILSKAYAESIHPSGDASTWTCPDSFDNFFCAPPGTKPSSGRPPKKRKRAAGEFGVPNSKYQRHRCNRCGKEGHNKSTCRTNI